MKCLKCNTEIPDGAKFCLECGSNISSMSGQSGVEENSFGSFQTVVNKNAGVDEHSDQGGSLGDFPTIVKSGASQSGQLPMQELSERYELGEEIGSGGFATVYKALDKKLNRTVAIKKLHPEKSDETTAARFRREALSIASLNHKNIVQVYDVGEDSATRELFLVMEFVEGGTLKEFLKEKSKLTLKEALPLFKGIAQGLSYAHRKNLVHRDIKPANILLTDNLEPKIVDFGLAQAGRDSELSMSGYGMGTACYMPPEQRRDAKSVNHTADIYSLGKVLYEMVTGEMPDTLDPSEIPPPPQLSEIIFKCTKPKPEDRFFSVDELIRDLESIAPETGDKVKKKVSSANQCPSCGTENEKEARFCEGCGTGLFRNCPECEKEDSVNKQFCIACGTDVDGFIATQDILQKMEKYVSLKKWTRVKKEYEQFDKSVRLPGEKGTELLSQIENINVENSEVLAKIANLEKKLPQAKIAFNNSEWQNVVDLLTDLPTTTEEVDSESSRLIKEKNALLAQANGHLPTSIKIVAMIDGREVNATLTNGSQSWTTPKTVNLKEDGDYNFSAEYIEGKKRYKCKDSSITADWKGLKEKRLDLQEVKRPLDSETWVAELGNGVTMELLPVEPGSFDMGSKGFFSSTSEKPMHRVTLTKPFWIGKYEVTQKQYETVMRSNPSSFKGSDNPVEKVSWNDAMEFCKKLTDKEHASGRLPADYKYTLPTEAQWEFAARGGIKSSGYKYSGSDDLDRVGWHDDNSGSKTHAVGQKAANALGLYDMSGNVYEWCSDWYGDYPLGSVVDPTGASSGSFRVYRGGSWFDCGGGGCRSADRDWDAPTSANGILGFRLCLQTD